MDTENKDTKPSDNIRTTLNLVKPGTRCRVIKVTGKGMIFKRIIDIGIRTGSEIFVERVAPLGDPVEFQLKGFHVSLRKTEAENILVEVLQQ